MRCMRGPYRSVSDHCSLGETVVVHTSSIDREGCRTGCGLGWVCLSWLSSLQFDPLVLHMSLGPVVIAHKCCILIHARHM